MGKLQLGNLLRGDGGGRGMTSGCLRVAIITKGHVMD